VQNLLSYKEKHTAEFKVYKEKFENLIVGLSSQLENVERSMKNFTTKLLQDTEVNFKREYDNIGVKIGDMRLENNKYAYQLQKNANELTSEKEKILALKSEVNKQLDVTLEKCKEMNKNTFDSFETIKGEYQSIKNKFVELSEFIKDVRFRKNLGVDVSKQDIKKLTNKITSDRKISNINDYNTNKNIPNQEYEKNVLNKKTKNSEIIDNNLVYNLDNAKEEENNDEIKLDDFDIGSYVKKYIQGDKNKNRNISSTKINGANNHQITLKQLQTTQKNSNRKTNNTNRKLTNDDINRNTRENIDCNLSNNNIKNSDDYFNERKNFTVDIIREQTEEFNTRATESFKFNNENTKNENYETDLQITKEKRIRLSDINTNKNEEDIVEKKEKKKIKNSYIKLESKNDYEEDGNSSDSRISSDTKEKNIYITSENILKTKAKFNNENEIIIKGKSPNEKKNNKKKSNTDKNLIAVSNNKENKALSPNKNSGVTLTENLNTNNQKIKSDNSLNSLNQNNQSNKTTIKKFKDKFPTSKNKYSGGSGDNLFRSLEKMEKEELAKKAFINTEINSIIFKDNSMVSTLNRNINNREFANILGEFNENIFSFKKEFFKKVSSTENRINQIEYFAKKKFEELASQIKNYIPINFNAYMKDFKEKIPEQQNSTNTKINQLNVENLIINENLGVGQNFSLKVIDTSTMKFPMNTNQNKKNVKTVLLNKTNNNNMNSTFNNLNIKGGRNSSANNQRPILRETNRKYL